MILTSFLHLPLIPTSDSVINMMGCVKFNLWTSPIYPAIHLFTNIGLFKIKHPTHLYGILSVTVSKTINIINIMTLVFRCEQLFSFPLFGYKLRYLVNLSPPKRPQAPSSNASISQFSFDNLQAHNKLKTNAFLW